MRPKPGLPAGMGLISLTRRRHEPLLRLPRRELACLRRWITATAAAGLAPVTPPATERREAGRQSTRMAAELRPISAGGIGLIRPAVVCDVSADGIALRLEEPLKAGQQISVEIQPPPDTRRPLRRAESPVQILAVVRYCRPDGNGHIVGCTIGVEWSATLANQMFPADLVRRRSA